MKDQVRRVAVTEPLATAGRNDYADTFELRLSEPDPHPPETWVRAGLGSTPPFVKRIVGLLGLGGSAESSADRLAGFRILESTAEVIHLEVTVSLLRVVMVGRRVEPMRRQLTTILYYERPLAARVVWAVIAPLHRRTARKLITGALPTEQSIAGGA